MKLGSLFDGSGTAPLRNETVKCMRNTSLPLNKINRILGDCADQTVMEVVI